MTEQELDQLAESIKHLLFENAEVVSLSDDELYHRIEELVAQRAGQRYMSIQNRIDAVQRTYQSIRGLGLLDELLRAADLISLHCPLTAETHHLINAETIAQMRDNAILVNTSRGGLIDTNALIDALRARKLAGVGLDVYEDEDGQVFEDFSDDVLENEVVPVLLSFPNVVITSHQAFFTRTALQSIAITTMENARAFERGEKLVNEVRE